MEIHDEYMSGSLENKPQKKTIEKPPLPGKDLIADYIKWYYESDSTVRGDKSLDMAKFMEYSYDLSEKAAPFLSNCDMGKDDICKEFMDEANKQWEIVKQQPSQIKSKEDLKDVLDDTKVTEMF